MKLLRQIKIRLWFFLSLLIIISGIYASAEVRNSFKEAKQKKESQVLKQQTIEAKDAKQKVVLENENARLAKQLSFYLQKLKEGLENNSLYPQDSEDITILELARAKDPRAISLLIEVLNRYPVVLARADAARALGEIGDRSAVPALKEALNDKDYQVKVGAAMALIKVGEKEDAFQILAKVATKEKVAEWTINVERELGQRKGADRETWRQKLITQYKEESLPGQAIAGLSEINGERSIRIIEEVLKDDNAKLKLIASSYLIKLGRESAAIPGLINIAKDEYVGLFVRTSAISLLAKLRTDEVRDALSTLALDKNETIKKKASAALAGMK